MKTCQMIARKLFEYLPLLFEYLLNICHFYLFDYLMDNGVFC
uniref:Uncharacterized protein n=1 Tax=Meloidogyne enterolobii TaxID=390850 RepID=A0A6V7UMK5_MELEN|nr:unnamed protein product [Meloidogyne enterolobii]